MGSKLFPEGFPSVAKIKWEYMHILGLHGLFFLYQLLGTVRKKSNRVLLNHWWEECILVECQRHRVNQKIQTDPFISKPRREKKLKQVCCWWWRWWCFKLVSWGLVKQSWKLSRKYQKSRPLHILCASRTSICNCDILRGFKSFTSIFIDLFLFRGLRKHLKTHKC